MTAAVSVALACVVQAGAFSGHWESTIELAPNALVFGELVRDLASQLVVDYTLYGWSVSSDSTFRLAGLCDQVFTIFGSLGAFALSATSTFDPLIAESITYTLAKGVTYQLQSVIGVTSMGASAAWTNSIWNCARYDEKVSYTTGAFSSLQASAQVSLYGVNFEGLFYLKGNDFEAKTFSNKWIHGNPYTDWAGVATQTGTYTASPCLPGYGSGWKLSLSGLAGEIRVTSRTYFNLEEYSFNELMTQLRARTYVADTFTLGGSYYLPKKDGETCQARFTREFLILEGVTLGCTNFDVGLNFTCEGFDWFKLLITGVELMPCVSFDALITFSVAQIGSSKMVTLEPKVLLGDMGRLSFRLACDYASDSLDFSLDALKINGFSFSYTWDGISFVSSTSFNPIYGSLGGYYLAAPVKSPKTYGFFIPDKDFPKDSFCSGTDCTESTGTGYYMQACFPEEYYEIWEKISIQATGDGCCGGNYTCGVSTYFGDRKTLIPDSFWFWYKDEDGNSYQYNPGTPTTRTEPAVSGSAPPYCEDDDVSYGVAYYDADENTLLGLVKTDVDVVIPISTSIDLAFGAAIDVYGWERFELGFSLSW